MPRLDRDGVGIAYEVTRPSAGADGAGGGVDGTGGRADGGGGGVGAGVPVPLLLSHGYGASARMWDPNVPALSAGRTVVTWDQRGHGESDSPSDPGLYSEAVCVADMAALLDHLGIERAVIGGLSLGGYLSLAFHLAHGQRVAALVLADTGPGYKDARARDGWNDMARRQAEALEQRGEEALSRSAEVRAAGHHGTEGLALAARRVLTQHDAAVIESLPSIRVPTLIVVGSEDKPFLAASEYMEKKIPGARRVVLDGAGHASNIDRADAFNQSVGEFLSSLDG